MSGGILEGVIKTSDNASVGSMGHLCNVYWTTVISLIELQNLRGTDQP